MKKSVNILLIIAMLLNNILTFFTISVFAQEVTDIKKNENSYWNTKNAPLFYGATKITIKKGMIDKFDLFDPRFRIFASDFEDGDLTTNITSTGKVNVNQVGTYNITYKVKDSHNNETVLTVPVIITDDEDAKINVERTLYTIPSTWNMNLVGFSRCNSGDRQILGIYLSEGQSIRARVLSSSNDINVSFLANDSKKESSMSIPMSGEWTTLTNVKDETSYDSIPVLTSTVLSKEQTKINKTYKIELEYDNTISALNYYHYKDNENNFKTKWISDNNTYGVIENEVLTVIVPLSDINKLTNYYSKSFKSFDQFLEYYKKVVDKMDEYVGLDLNPKKLTDQNVRTKYLVKANAHGAGAAYYAGNHVGINSSSVAPFFEMNWGGLHELAHGYQGNFGKGQMNLGEVGNNIIGHYIQTDKDIYFHSGDWLGLLPNIEDSKNANRLATTSFNELDVQTKLYMIVNLLDYFEGGTSYSKMFSWFREKVYDKTITDLNANQDYYALSIAEIYNVNIIPYLESWGLTISNNIKEQINSKNYPVATILKDMVSDSSLSNIMTKENIGVKYGIVENKVYEKNGVVGNFKLTIEIDDMDLIKGKYLLIKNGYTTVKKVKITSNVLEINDLAVGAYYLQMPILNNYDQDSLLVLIKEGEKSQYTYKYTALKNIDPQNYLSVVLKGIYDTYGYKLTFSDYYKKATISFGQAGYYNGDVKVVIKDTKKNIVSEEIKGYDSSGNRVDGGQYFNFNKPSYTVNLEPGYTIEITHYNYKNKVSWINTLTNINAISYTPKSSTTVYKIVENGIIMNGMDEEERKNIEYESLKQYAINIIDNYKATVTKEEIENRIINYKKKPQVIYVYGLLKDVDKKPYQEFITKIIQGGIPKILLNKDTILEYNAGINIDLYSLITATDEEDGIIKINKENTKIDTLLDTNKKGVYAITYSVSDSDNNTSTYTILITIINDLDSGSISEENKTNPDDKVNSSDDSKPLTNNHKSNYNGSIEKLSKTKVYVPNTMTKAPLYMYIIGILLFGSGVILLYLSIKKAKLQN